MVVLPGAVIVISVAPIPIIPPVIPVPVPIAAPIPIPATIPRVEPIEAVPLLIHPNLDETPTIPIEVQVAVPIVVENDDAGVADSSGVEGPAFDRNPPREDPRVDDPARTRIVTDVHRTRHRSAPDSDVGGNPLRLGPARKRRQCCQGESVCEYLMASFHGGLLVRSFGLFVVRLRRAEMRGACQHQSCYLTTT